MRKIAITTLLAGGLLLSSGIFAQGAAQSGPATLKAMTLENGTRVPYTWKFPSYGNKLLILRGMARIDRVSTSLGIMEQGELTVTGPGYSTTETFLQTASGGTGKFTKIFSHGGETFADDGTFTWQRSSSGGNVQLKIIVKVTGHPNGSGYEEIAYTSADGVMGIQNTSRSSNSTSTGVGTVSTSATGEASAYVQPSRYKGAETAALCGSSARASCEAQSGYSGPALPDAVLAVQAWQMMGVTVWIAMHSPAHH